MRFILATVIYLYSSMLWCQELYVQSQTITDLYGSVFLEKLNAKNVIYLERQAKPNEVKNAVTQYAEAHKFDKIVVLGQKQDLEGQYFPILTQFELPEILNGSPVYILQGTGRLAQERKKVFESLKPEEFEIRTDYDLRKALVTLRNKPKGFVVINVFSMTDSWGDKRSYQTIEETVTAHRFGHVEVGVCYPGFKTALAVGPTADPIDVSKVVASGKSGSLCANLDRLRLLGRLDLYTQSAGKFYRVHSHTFDD